MTTMIDNAGPTPQDEPLLTGPDPDAAPAGAVDVVAPKRRGVRVLAAHPVATGAVAAVLAAGLGFGGGFWAGSASAADGVTGTVDGTFPGGLGPGPAIVRTRPPSTMSRPRRPIAPRRRPRAGGVGPRDHPGLPSRWPPRRA